MRKESQTEEAAKPEKSPDVWEELQRLTAGEAERNATEEAINEFGLGDPRWGPFEARLRELSKSLAATNAPGKARAISYFRDRYLSFSSDPLAVVLLKALCAVYDSRLQGTPQTKELRRFLRHNLPKQLKQGRGLQIPGANVRVSLWDQERVRPACQELLKLYREESASGAAVAQILARSFAPRGLSMEQGRQIAKVIDKNWSPHIKARATVARYLNVSQASVDNFYKSKFTGSRVKSLGAR